MKLGFNYDKFKAALKKSQEDSNAILMDDLQKVKVTVEKLLTMCLESTASSARASYPGVDM